MLTILRFISLIIVLVAGMQICAFTGRHPDVPALTLTIACAAMHWSQSIPLSFVVTHLTRTGPWRDGDICQMDSESTNGVAILFFISLGRDRKKLKLFAAAAVASLRLPHAWCIDTIGGLSLN